MNSTDNEILEVVDSLDRVVGIATRKEIHDEGLEHRAAHVFVFNSAGDLYVQRRSSSKDRHPLKLDSSAAGHVDPRESYYRTATRELEEELSLVAEIHEVLKIAACEATDNEHVTLFATVTDKEPKPNPDEIMWGGFMSRETVDRLMEGTPEDFVPAFILLWKEFSRENT